MRQSGEYTAKFSDPRGWIEGICCLTFKLLLQRWCYSECIFCNFQKTETLYLQSKLQFTLSNQRSSFLEFPSRAHMYFWRPQKRPRSGLPCPSQDLNPPQRSQARAVQCREQPLHLSIGACELHAPVEGVTIGRGLGGGGCKKAAGKPKNDPRNHSPMP